MSFTSGEKFIGSKSEAEANRKLRIHRDFLFSHCRLVINDVNRFRTSFNDLGTGFTEKLCPAVDLLADALNAVPDFQADIQKCEYFAVKLALAVRV
ncbi:hypothetical protein ABBQ32_007086 [Trebouxia sp. C0010 RCD-2024]